MPLDTRLEECTIVWLCPLEVELRAAIAMLDRSSEDIPPRVRGQQVVYTVGQIGHHKVAVVGYYQEQGLAASGSMAAEVIRDLPNLQFGLLVGTAGGIPSSTNDMQLGDVAVAVPEGDRPGIVGYDLGKEGDDSRYELKHWQNSTHPLLRSIINILRARNDSRFSRHLRIIDELPEFQRPETGLREDRRHPKVHYGTILSGNTVIKSQSKRDQLRDMYGGIAVEMEAAGIMTRLPVAVIRGISNFADSSKNNAWQKFAAFAAAAYAKELLLRLPYEVQSHVRNFLPEASGEYPRATSSTPFADKALRLAHALPEKWAFVGRTEEMVFLEAELGFPAQPPIRRSIACLWGLTGVGKSQLAAGFVNQQLASHPEREIFWINGESQEAFERTVISMLKSSSNYTPYQRTLPRISERERHTLVNLFFAELNQIKDGKWLLVIDGVSESTSSTIQYPLYNIHSHISELNRGFILLTSRRRDIVERYHPIWEVKGLKDEDATSLLNSQVHPDLMEGALDLISLLKGLPLALRLATSVISRYRYQIREYLEMWKIHSDASEILGEDKTLYGSLELSLENFEKVDPISAKILTLFSFLDPNDLWYEVCHNAAGNRFPLWLQELARNKTPFRHFYPLLTDQSFIELKVYPNGTRMWQTHPAIQVVARQRAKTGGQEQDYIRCAISLVAAQVPRSSEANAWATMRRLVPHVQLCWSYIKGGRCGPNTNLTELESLARVFRQVGNYDEASIIYRMIARGLDLQDRTSDTLEFQADVLTNLGLVYTYQRKFSEALRTFDGSLNLMSSIGRLSPDASMSIGYNKAVVFMLTDRLDEAEKLLQNAAAHFSPETDEHVPSQNEQKSLYLRILNDLGEVFLRKGKVSEAFELFQHVYYYQRNRQGEPHPALISLKLNMGRTLTKLENFPEARDLLLEVISIYTDWWGRRHPETMRAIDEIAWTFMNEAKYKQANGENNELEVRSAEELWNEALSFYRCADADESDTVTRLEANLRHLYSLRKSVLDI